MNTSDICTNTYLCSHRVSFEQGPVLFGDYYGQVLITGATFEKSMSDMIRILKFQFYLQANGIKTPFGEASTYNNCPASDEKRSQFSRKVFINHVQLSCIAS